MKSITNFCDFLFSKVLCVLIFFIELLSVYPLSSNAHPLSFRYKIKGFAKCTMTSSASTITRGKFNFISKSLICL